MRYEEFRDRLQDALRDAGLVFEHIGQPPEKSTSPAAPSRWAHDSPLRRR